MSEIQSEPNDKTIESDEQLAYKFTMYKNHLESKKKRLGRVIMLLIQVDP